MEFVVDAIESLGLGGRSIGGPVLGPPGNKEVVDEFVTGDTAFRASRGVLGILRDDAEALIVASRRRRSSNGAPVPGPAPVLACSLDSLFSLEGLRIGVRDRTEVVLREDMEGMREYRPPPSLFLDFKKTVCGTTPSF